LSARNKGESGKVETGQLGKKEGKANFADAPWRDQNSMNKLKGSIVH